MSMKKNKTDRVISSPQSDLQKLAQKENYALFQLAGIVGQLNSCNFDFLQDKLIAMELSIVRDTLKYVQIHIKCVQSDRKRARRIK